MVVDSESSFIFEQSTYEGSTVMLSEQGARKTLYQKVNSISQWSIFFFHSYVLFLQIVTSFPDGWMSSGYISREGEF